MAKKYHHHYHRKKKKTIYGEGVLTVFLILFIGIFIGLIINVGTPELVTSGELPEIEALSLNGFVPVNITVIPNIITLNAGCYELAMVTTSAQTVSINSGLEGIRGFRPVTHDLITDIVDMFEMNVLMVKIESLLEGTYFSKVFIMQGKKVLSLDSKPSDAIAIAVRSQAPIYIKQTLIEQEGDYIC